jgi:hypothetical protein
MLKKQKILKNKIKGGNCNHPHGPNPLGGDKSPSWWLSVTPPKY